MQTLQDWMKVHAPALCTFLPAMPLAQKFDAKMNEGNYKVLALLLTERKLVSKKQAYLEHQFDHSLLTVCDGFLEDISLWRRNKERPRLSGKKRGTYWCFLSIWDA
jgi:hypothetical protein